MMDPNANLLEQLELADALLNGTYETPEEVAADAERLAELVQALNDWLSKGGFPPDAWKAQKT